MYDGKNFYSIDRLVEFGMSTAVAQQMVNSMNYTMKNMHIPGADNPLQISRPQEPVAGAPPLDLVYYAMIDGKQAGPYCETELGRLINDRKVCKGTYIWHTGLEEWTTAENIPAVLRFAALVPPPPPQGV